MDSNTSRRVSLPDIRTDFSQAPDAIVIGPEENMRPNQLNPDETYFDETEEKASANFDQLAEAIDFPNDTTGHPTQYRYETPEDEAGCEEWEDDRRNFYDGDRREQHESSRRDQYEHKVANWQENRESPDAIIYTLQQNVYNITQKCHLLDSQISRERWNVVRVQNSLQMQVETTTQAVQNLAYVTEKKDELTRENGVLRGQIRELCQAFNQLSIFESSTGAIGIEELQARSHLQHVCDEAQSRSAKRRRPSSFCG